MKTMKMRALSALAAFGCLLAANAAPAQDKASALPPNVVARQGGIDVTVQDIDAFAQKLPDKDRAGFFDSPTRIQSVITGLLINRQLAAEARSAKLDQDALVRRELDQSRDETLARVRMDQFRKDLKLPKLDALAEEYYAVHKEEFVVPGSVEVKHVLVSTKGRSDEQAKARVGEVLATARAHPDQFDALVEKYSDDPSKSKNHGVIDDAASTKMVAPFAKAAAALKNPGDLSPIVKTDYGYHVVMLVSRAESKQQSFSEVHDKLVAKLGQEWIEKQVKDHADNLRSQPLDANADLVASLRTRFLPPGAMLPSDADAAAREEALKKKAAEQNKAADKT
jgi:parvulin-like peptidyl-prolyl isomerase